MLNRAKRKSVDKTEEYQEIARQLQKPTGENGLQIAKFMNDGNERLNRNTIGELKMVPNAKVLEIGMGNGAFVHELFKIEPDLTYYGFDYSELMISEATKLNEYLVEQVFRTFAQSSCLSLLLRAKVNYLK